MREAGLFAFGFVLFMMLVFKFGGNADEKKRQSKKDFYDPKDTDNFLF